MVFRSLPAGMTRLERSVLTESPAHPLLCISLHSSERRENMIELPLRSVETRVCLLYDVSCPHSPTDSSAARIPFPLATMRWAISESSFFCSGVRAGNRWAMVTGLEESAEKSSTELWWLRWTYYQGSRGMQTSPVGPSDISAPLPQMGKQMRSVPPSSPRPTTYTHLA